MKRKLKRRSASHTTEAPPCGNLVQWMLAPKCIPPLCSHVTIVPCQNGDRHWGSCQNSLIFPPHQPLSHWLGYSFWKRNDFLRCAVCVTFFYNRQHARTCLDPIFYIVFVKAALDHDCTVISNPKKPTAATKRERNCVLIR